MSFLKSLFALDLFGVPLFINFKNRKKRSSPIGLFFSLVLIGENLSIQPCLPSLFNYIML